MSVFFQRGIVVGSLLAVLVWLPCRPGICLAETGPSAQAGPAVVVSPGGAVWTRDGNPAGKELTWKEAHDFLRDLNRDLFGSCAAWRLPERDELAALLAWLNSGNADNEAVSPEQDFYWSATTDPMETDYAYAVNMGDGSVDICEKSDFNYVWPVCGR